MKISIPDIGGFDQVEVIEVLVSEGEEISKEQALISLESDKASMDVPSPYAGVIQSILVKVGDNVAEGTEIIAIKPLAEEQAPTEVAKIPEQKNDKVEALPTAPKSVLSVAPDIAVETEQGIIVHAGPSARKFARELGIDLAKVKGAGRKNRILIQDIKDYVKNSHKQSTSVSGLSVMPLPEIDFALYGAVETKKLSKIQKLTGANLHRNWVSIPHVTQFDVADITDMDKFRKAHAEQAKAQGLRLTPLVFMMKALVGALRTFPKFNASLDASGEQLILKSYYHIGVAVDTPNGLVVPVIRDVDGKGLYQLAEELIATSERAREGKLMPQDMRGGCMTISSLGGIGGTAFTPIINAPEVAILGISKATIKPVFKEGEFVPRLMCPLSLSYDHRVIDGADAARFISYLSLLLTDIRRLLL